MLDSLTKQNFMVSLSRFTTSELETMIEKFPYFQQAHLLLAKKYQLEGNHKFDQQLQLAALYTQDRDLLYSVFNEETLANQVTQAATTTSELPALQVEQIVDPVQETISVKDAEKFAENTIEEVTTEHNVEVISVPQIIEQEETSLTRNDVFEEPVTSIIDETEVVFDIHLLHTFDEWLQAFSITETVDTDAHEQLKAKEPETEKLDEELEKLYLSNIPLDLQELVEEETHYSKGLDKFIEEQIERKKTKPSAVKSNTLKAPVTETMAKILEQQKKYTKAIECYNQLAILYPEKNDFFAARINYLKTLL